MGEGPFPGLSYRGDMTSKTCHFSMICSAREEGMCEYNCLCCIWWMQDVGILPHVLDVNKMEMAQLGKDLDLHPLTLMSTNGCLFLVWNLLTNLFAISRHQMP